MSLPPIDIVARLVEEGGDVDDILRGVVSALAARSNLSWAGIAFNEDGTLRLGPCSGQADEARREHVPIAIDDAVVGELWVDGESRCDELGQVAALIAPYVLIGWDTGGEVWDP
jgi:putative methionine-R-sulfoxide reductase with GAF domain